MLEEIKNLREMLQVIKAENNKTQNRMEQDQLYIHREMLKEAVGEAIEKFQDMQEKMLVTINS